MYTRVPVSSMDNDVCTRLLEPFSSGSPKITPQLELMGKPDLSRIGELIINCRVVCELGFVVLESKVSLV